jgi:hypothetical protein
VWRPSPHSARRINADQPTPLARLDGDDGEDLDCRRHDRRLPRRPDGARAGTSNRPGACHQRCWVHPRRLSLDANTSTLPWDSCASCNSRARSPATGLLSAYEPPWESSNVCRSRAPRCALGTKRLDATAQTLARIANENANAWMRQGLEAAAGCDGLIVGGLAAFIGFSAAEKLGVPAIGEGMIPLTPSSAFPSPFLPPRPMPRWLNRFSYRLVAEVLWRAFRDATNAARAEQHGGLRPACSDGCFGCCPSRPASPLLSGLERDRFTRAATEFVCDWRHPARLAVSPHVHRYPSRRIRNDTLRSPCWYALGRPAFRSRPVLLGEAAAPTRYSARNSERPARHGCQFVSCYRHRPNVRDAGAGFGRQREDAFGERLGKGCRESPRRAGSLKKTTTDPSSQARR